MFLWYHRRAKLDAPAVVTALEDLFPRAVRLLDVGAGTGVFAAQAKAQGHQVVACERSRLARWIAAAQGVDVRPLDLKGDPPAALNSTFDLAYCLEVAEHLDPVLGDRLVKFLAATATAVVFTAAPPGQGGAGHINEQAKPYWISRFQHVGMRYREDLAHAAAVGFVSRGARSEYLSSNVMVFEHLPAAP